MRASAGSIKSRERKREKIEKGREEPNWRFGLGICGAKEREFGVAPAAILWRRKGRKGDEDEIGGRRTRDIGEEVWGV